MVALSPVSVTSSTLGFSSIYKDWYQWPTGWLEDWYEILLVHSMPVPVSSILDYVWFWVPYGNSSVLLHLASIKLPPSSLPPSPPLPYATSSSSPPLSHTPCPCVSHPFSSVESLRHNGISAETCWMTHTPCSWDHSCFSVTVHEIVSPQMSPGLFACYS